MEVAVRRDAARADKEHEESESGEGSAWITGALHHCRADVVYRCGYWHGDEKVVPRGGVDEFEKQPGGVPRALPHPARARRRRSGIGVRCRRAAVA
jgi:hypothetical protein